MKTPWPLAPCQINLGWATVWLQYHLYISGSRVMKWFKCQALVTNLALNPGFTTCWLVTSSSYLDLLEPWCSVVAQVKQYGCA
jgi:hypothetical protein